MNPTKIPWTEKTWNPVTGCTWTSRGCDHCYARRFAERWRGIEGHPYEQGFDFKLHPDRLMQPEKWKKPSRIFVCSMADLFQTNVSDAFLDRVFETMERASWHTFQLLTKRPHRMMTYINRRGGVPHHIWVGTTVESSLYAEVRVPKLQRIKADVKFLSCEPLLGPIKFASLEGISQVIVGGESGPQFRQMESAWAEDILQQCRAAGTRFFFKQHAGIRPRELGHRLNGKEYREWPE